jgi:8-oxo-dGTP pyrophosphatase MutT (NUDIX family)
VSFTYDLAAIRARLASLEPGRDVETAGGQASVAAVLRAPQAGHEAEILFIRRSEREGDPWSGHMAFPGGRRDPSDPSLYHTALRETREEIGLDLAEHARLVARLPDVPAVMRSRRIDMVVSAFVFALDEPEPPPLTLNHEVAEVLWVPVGPMARGEISTTYPFVYEGQPLDLPAFSIEQRIVWGLTYRMMELLFEVIHRD